MERLYILGRCQNPVTLGKYYTVLYSVLIYHGKPINLHYQLLQQLLRMAKAAVTARMSKVAKSIVTVFRQGPTYIYI